MRNRLINFVERSPLLCRMAFIVTSKPLLPKNSVTSISVDSAPPRNGGGATLAKMEIRISFPSISQEVV